MDLLEYELRRPKPILQAIGILVIIVGIFLIIGNRSGFFPTLPYLGGLVMLFGIAILGAGLRKLVAKTPVSAQNVKCATCGTLAHFDVTTRTLICYNCRVPEGVRICPSCGGQNLRYDTSSRRLFCNICNKDVRI